MQIPPLTASFAMPLRHRHTYPFAHKVVGILLLILAVLGNAFNVDMFFGVNFLFGSVFAWIAFLILGPVWGLLIILVASLYTVQLWGHWYAFTLFTGEFIFVFALQGHRRIERLIGLSSIYWLVIGGPISLLLYKFFIGLPWETVSLVVAKQALNALTNACLGLLVFYSILYFNPPFLRRKYKRASLTNFLQILFISALLFPLGAFEFLSLSREFDAGIQEKIDQENGNLSRFNNNISDLLATETRHWTVITSTLDFNNQPSSVDLLDQYKNDDLAMYPISAYQLSTDGEAFDLLFGKTDLVLEDLNREFLSNRNFIPDSLIGCVNNSLLTTSDLASSIYFVWSLDIMNVLSPDYGLGEKITLCDTDWLSQTTVAAESPATGLEMNSVSDATLAAWLGAVVKGSAQLNSFFPTTYESSTSLRPFVVDIQKATRNTVVTLYFLAIFMVMLSYILYKILALKFEKFTYLVQKFLTDREIDMDLVNFGISEDRDIYRSLLNLSDSFSEEEAARKIVVESFDKLIENTTTPIFATDEYGTIKFWNNTLESLTGYSKDDVIGSVFQELASVDFRTMFIENEKSELEFEFTIKSKAGKFINLTASQTIIRDLSSVVATTSPPVGTDEALHFFIAQDQTEAVNARAHMVHMSRFAALGEMASTFAHELAQPLNVITLAAGNSLERLRTETVPAEYLREKMGRIENQALRAGEVIRNIREFSLANHDEDVEIFNTVAHCKVAIDLVREQFRLASINLEFFQNADGALIEGRPILFEQVIINILNNARQAMQHGSDFERKCNVNVSTHDDYVSIEISDTGPGFEENEISKVFEPFYTTKADQYGTGIGLYMSQTIVRAMGGEIWVHNGKSGAVVSMRFPIV